MTYVMYDVAHVTSEVYQTNGWVLLSLILQQTDKQTIQHNTRDMNIKQAQNSGTSRPYIGTASENGGTLHANTGTETVT